MTTKKEKGLRKYSSAVRVYTREQKNEKKKRGEKFIKYFWMTEQEDAKTETEIGEKKREVTYTRTRKEIFKIEIPKTHPLAYSHSRVMSI